MKSLSQKNMSDSSSSSFPKQIIKIVLSLLVSCVLYGLFLLLKQMPWYAAYIIFFLVFYIDV